MQTRQLHYVSGIVLMAFIALHLFNHLYSLGGAQKHIEMMNTVRLIYRNPLIEIILVASVVVQIISGIRLVGDKRKVVKTTFEKLHVWSGLYLAFFLTFHVSVVMMGRYLLHLDTNLYFGAAGLNTFPFYFIFFPYYGLSIMAVFSHIAAVHHYKMKSNLLGLAPEQQSKGILIVGLLVTGLIFYGLTNQFHGLIIPNEYDVMILK
jgi:succinate dehydrogenase/fumarate reductase cytochrome b subunit